MTKEEVNIFAEKPTNISNNKTELEFKNGNFVFGYFEFDNNRTDKQKLYEQNKWSFVQYPIDEINKYKIIEGNDIKKIKNHTVL